MGAALHPPLLQVCPLSIVWTTPWNSSRAVNHVFVSSVLVFQTSSRALNTLLMTCQRSCLHACFPLQTTCRKLFLGFIRFSGSVDVGLASTFSPHGTNPWCGRSPCNRSNGARPSRPLRHVLMMFPACSISQGSSGESSLTASCLVLPMWHASVLMMPRSCNTAFSVRPFVCLSPTTASSVATSALRPSATQFVKATVASLVSLFNVISRYPTKLENFTTLSIDVVSSKPFSESHCPSRIKARPMLQQGWANSPLLA